MASGAGKKSSITIKVDASKAIAKIKAMQDGTADMQPVFAAVGRAIKTKIDLCFKLGIDPWGSPWAALKIRKGQPLVDTGLLRRSITSNPDATGVTIGTNLRNKDVSYPAVHQFGSPKKRIPSRPFLPLKKSENVVTLPPSWSVSVTRALRTYFLNEAKKESA